MKTLFYAAMAASFALIVSSCEKDSATKNAAAPFRPSHQLNFITSKILNPGDPVTMIAIDSNTAIIIPTGDTVFPEWYYKEKAASGTNARANISVPTDWDQISVFTEPKKAANNSSQAITITSKRLNQNALFNLRGTDGSVYTGGSYPIGTVNATMTVNIPSFAAQCGVSYYVSVVTNEDANPNNFDMVIHSTPHPFYIYSFQQFAGQGTAYGADMKIVNLAGPSTRGDLLSVIANRNSNGVNGISYLFYLDVDSNANPISGHTALITLPMQSASATPKGVAAAVGNIGASGATERDLLLATYTKLNTESAYTIKYLVGRNLNSTTGVATWAQAASAPISVPGFGDNIIDIGMAIADLDANGTNDVLIIGISPTQILYRVGYNMTLTGSADFSSPVKSLVTVSGNIIGGGIDTDGSTFAVGYYTNDTPLFHNVLLPWDNATQAFGASLYAYNRATVGVSGVGGGISMGDLNGDSKPDVLSMAYVGGAFRFVVDYTYDPATHRELVKGICGANTN